MEEEKRLDDSFIENKDNEKLETIQNFIYYKPVIVFCIAASNLIKIFIFIIIYFI